MAHIHNLHFKKEKFETVAKKLQHDVVQLKPRLLMVDGNKKAFALLAFLCGSQGASSSSSRLPLGREAGLEVNLVACHAEFAQVSPKEIRKKRESHRQRTSPDAEADWDNSDEDSGDEGINGTEHELENEILHDSMLIATIGPHGRIRSEGPSRHALLAAAWPQDAAAGVRLQVGFPAATYAANTGVAPVEDPQMRANFDTVKRVFENMKCTAEQYVSDVEMTTVRKLTVQGLVESE